MKFKKVSENIINVEICCSPTIYIKLNIAKEKI